MLVFAVVVIPRIYVGGRNASMSTRQSLWNLFEPMYYAHMSHHCDCDTEVEVMYHHYAFR